MSYDSKNENGTHIANSITVIRNKKDIKQKYLKIISLIYFGFISLASFSQEDSIAYYLKEVNVTANDSAYRIKYSRTKYFVKEIYVYSVLAADMLNEIEDSLSLLDSKKAKKKYIKKSYKSLKKEFGYEISQLTISRGHYLMKILHKETGRTAYEIVTQYRGKLQAKTWETILRLNETTLKKYYSPEIEDIILDRVLKEIEEGKIIPTPRPPVTERGRKAARKRKKAKRKKDRIAKKGKRKQKKKK